ETTAVQLYAAILTDTGRFRYNSTSPRTMEIGGKLIGAGADPRLICDQVYFNLPTSTIKLIGHALESAEFLENGAICVLSLGKDVLIKHEARLSDTEGLAEYTLFGKGVEVGILLKEGKDGITRVSLRSREKVNVAELAAQFGGGGHICAAGCSIEKGLAETKKVLLKALSDFTNGK
ncbi:MAG: DHH family phosphoesterase, partial [Candidatus Zixiibacteriota bacterium]